MWQRWSPPQQRGGIQNCKTRDSTGDLPSEKTGDKAMTHVMIPKSYSAEWRDLKPWYTWQHIPVCRSVSLGLVPICEVHGLLVTASVYIHPARLE
jgi:hypothetical protein